MVTIKGLSLKLAVDQMTALANMLNTIEEPNLVNLYVSRAVSDAVSTVKTHDAEAEETLPFILALIDQFTGLTVSAQKGLSLTDTREINRLIYEISQRLTYIVTKDYKPDAIK